MELVYLRVEKYKNIEDQEFNFSPKFKCELKNNKTISYNKKNFINILPNGINAITIAGENGSGKSTILELIAKILSNDVEDITYTLIINRSSLNLYTNHDIKISDIVNNTDEVIIKGELENLYFIFQSNSFVTGYFDDLIDNFSSKLYKHYDSSKKDFNIRNQSWLNQFLNGNRILESYSLDGIKYRQKHSLYIEEFLTTFKNSKNLMQLNFIAKFQDIFFSMDLPNKLEISIPHNKNTAGIIEDGFYKKVKKTITNYHSKESIGTDEDYNEELTKGEENFLKILKTFSSQNNANDVIVLNLDDAKKLINSYTNIKIDIFDVKWYGLSTGQDAFINLFTLLLHGLESLREQGTEETDVIIALDEIENNFHPLWQKKIVMNLLDFLKIFLFNVKAERNLTINIQLVFSTHSPFVLSDFSKENILFLDKGKEIKPDIETFGSNIHTLLSHNFFMNEGLMGEFSKKKIQEIIKYHEFLIDKKLRSPGKEKDLEKLKKTYIEVQQKYFWNIQSIIGDDYLKQIIKNHLIEIEKILLGQDEAKKLEIERLHEQIAQLEES